MTKWVEKNKSYLIAGLIVLIASSVQSPFPPGEFYNLLAKPDFTPPSWAFGLVWPILYVLIAISLGMWLNYRHKITNESIDRWWSVNLLANALYSPIAFGVESLTGGFIAVVIVFISAILLATKLYKIRLVTSAYLLIPYILWTGFASILAFSLVVIN